MCFSAVKWKWSRSRQRDVKGMCLEVTGGDFALELGAAPSQRSLGDLPKEHGKMFE